MTEHEDAPYVWVLLYASGDYVVPREPGEQIQGFHFVGVFSSFEAIRQSLEHQENIPPEKWHKLNGHTYESDVWIAEFQQPLLDDEYINAAVAATKTTIRD